MFNSAYFPFLTGEVKCGAAALDIADRQNAPQHGTRYKRFSRMVSSEFSEHCGPFHIVAIFVRPFILHGNVYVFIRDSCLFALMPPVPFVT